MNYAMLPRDFCLVDSAPADAQASVAERIQLRRAMDRLNATEFFGANSELRFFLNRSTHRMVIVLVNRTTNEAIRTIPTARVLQFAADPYSAAQAQ